ncbi:hypothetical protein KKG71_00040 [Patescibacteria group bacterium]|nr:hypothetical protein [Patescibacteria group bacterium]
MISLNAQYSVEKQGSDQNGYASVYADDLDEKIDKIIEMKANGRIDEKLAKRLIRLYLGKYLEQEIQIGVKTLFQQKSEDKKNKLLFMKWINKTSYEW